MTGELAPVAAAEVFDPLTGEVVQLDAPTDVLARVLWDIRDFENRLRGEKHRLHEELHRRMDAEARWSAQVGDFQVKGEAPGRVEYDAEKLKDLLSDLTDREVITARAATEAVEMVVTWKARVRGINALRKLGGEVAEVIRSCERPVERPRRVSVSEVLGG